MVLFDRPNYYDISVQKGTDYAAEYKEDGWQGRKVMALPMALWCATGQALYHLGCMVILGCTNRDIFCGYARAIGKDYQEAFGWLTAFFCDKLGLYYVDEARSLPPENNISSSTLNLETATLEELKKEKLSDNQILELFLFSALTPKELDELDISNRKEVLEEMADMSKEYLLGPKNFKLVQPYITKADYLFIPKRYLGNFDYSIMSLDLFKALKYMHLNFFKVLSEKLSDDQILGLFSITSTSPLTLEDLEELDISNRKKVLIEMADNSKKYRIGPENLKIVDPYKY